MTIDKAKFDQAIALIKKGPANADYFFEQLKSPDWIVPLREANLFAPYPAVRQGDTITFPFWTPGQYLARMAKLPDAQPLVLQALKELPDSDNPRVYQVVAECAAVLPTDMAAQLVPQLVKGLSLPYAFISPETYGTVIKRLADEKLGAEALRLARTVLAIQPRPPATADAEDAESIWLPQKARGRIDDWSYGQVLQASIESLVQSTELRALKMLCALLQAVVMQEKRDPAEAPRDYSYIWRPTIQDEESHHDGIKGDLVSAVRDASSQIVESSPDRLREVVEYLEGRPTYIFQRLAFHLLLRFGDRDLPVVQDVLDRPDDWDNPDLRPEYEILLSRFFGQLNPTVRSSFLGWIDKGRDVARYIAFRTSMDGHEPDAAEIKIHNDVWTRDHLAVLRDHLPPDYAKRLETLEAEHGLAHAPGERLFRVTSGWRGEHSPLTEEETLSLSWSALVSKLRSWSPPDAMDFEGPSPEGLASSVRQRVISNSRDAVDHLHEVSDVDPRYIAAILEALRDAIRKHEVVDWQAALAFLARIVDQAHAAYADTDSWRWVSKCAASLLDDSFDAEATSLPVSLRGAVWPILAVLAENPDPTPDHEARYGGTNMDPATLSINTVRGEAFHAVVRYALWWRRYLEAEQDSGARLQNGFEELPEVRALLERHLVPTTDPSLAVRAVYGQWFPWLVLLDHNWAREHVKDIFPTDPDSSDLSWAAWGAYVVYSNPFTRVLPILRPVYLKAITESDNGMARKVGLGERPSEHLARHLMAYYWRGELTLGADDLVVAFFSSASPKLCGHALEWIGRALGELEEPLGAEVHSRLTALWESRITNQASPEELQAFGWWFASSHLDQGWSLEMLKRVLAASVLPEPDHMVAERLAGLAASQPVEAVLCLERMVELAARGWSMHGWLDSARTILEAGLAHPEARAPAERIIHRLGTLRFQDFRTLLQTLPASE